MRLADCAFIAIPPIRGDGDGDNLEVGVDEDFEGIDGR